MSRLAELRAKQKAPRTDEKKFISLETEVTEVTKAPFGTFGTSIPEDIQFFLQSVTVVPATPETPGPTGTEPQKPPEPKERLCYQCQHFARSPYGYPLGLCVKHGNRIQHGTSKPTYFGCGTFEPKAVRS